VPHSHHCEKRKFIDPQERRTQQSRATQSSAESAELDELDELSAELGELSVELDESPVELDDLSALDLGPWTSDFAFGLALALGSAFAFGLALALAPYLDLGSKTTAFARGCKLTGLLDRKRWDRHGASCEDVDGERVALVSSNLAKNSWYKGSSSIAAARPGSSWELHSSKLFLIKSSTFLSL
jgi:hypothetical protein